jgi:type VI secretion system protein ImpH
MAGANGRLTVFAAPWAFEFHAALERLVGGPPAADGTPAFLRGHTDAGVAVADVTAASPSADGRPAELSVSALGLADPGGAAPAPFARAAAGEGAARDFFDVFQHRLLWLLHDAWRATRIDHQAERLAGLVLRSLGVSGLPSVPDCDLAGLAGLLAVPGRPAAALAQLLDTYFGVPAQVVPVGDDFRVRLGPMDRTRYDAFLPGGSALPPLLQLVRLFAGDTRQFDIELSLAAGEAAGCVLSESRLDWAAWLGPYGPASAEISPEACEAEHQRSWLRHDARHTES